MASVPAQVSTETGTVGSPAPHAAVIDGDPHRARRLGALLGTRGVVDPADADLLVLGFDRLGREEREEVARLREESPETALLVVVERAGPRTARDALSAGADALVLDDEAATCLAPAANAVLSGQIALPRSFGDGFRRPALSRREKQVLGLVVMGLLNAEIAAKLHVTESTVKSHLTSCFAKLGVRTRSEATSLILDPEGGLGLGVLAISTTEDADDA
jgi:DNA-binding NarL/FixJ family response regulator